MKKILLPTDFSDNARLSINYAAALYADEAVEYILIHVYNPPPMPAQVTSNKLSETIYEDIIRDLETEKNLLLKRLKNSDSHVTTLARKGGVAKVLSNAGKKQNADLIILSTRGAGQSLGFGSNTIALMKTSNLPVLVVPQDEEFQPYEKILFAADLQGYSKKVLKYPLDYFVREFDSTVEIVHIGTNENEEKNQVMGELVERFGDERTHVQYINEESVIEGMNNVVKEHQPDLLVLVNRHRLFFSRLFLKSVSNTMIIDASVPILILHDKV